ncbi:conserved hypothetical protein [Gammaproteobacteria bacterium]
MTRPHLSQVHCPNCKTFHTHETLFCRWIRNNPQLESADGHCFIDQDYWIHRFRIYGRREFQLLMLVEIKTLGSDLSDAQKDTLYMVDQVIRNRRQTPTKPLLFQAGRGPLRVRSLINHADIFLRVYGVHVLTFSGLGPDDSETILWDKKPIDLDILTGLLRFEIDPDSLRKLDLRNHHVIPQYQLPATLPSLFPDSDEEF